MRGLHELQAQFACSLLDEGPDVPPAVAGSVADRGAFDGCRRFNVYRNNVTLTLREALATTYPCIVRLVGEAFFARLARDFTRAMPPSEPNLDVYGEALARFLERYPPVAHLPYLPDVARLEWARIEAFRAADPPAFDFGGLAAVLAEEQPQLAFVLSPAARLIASAYPVLAIREMCLAETEPEEELDPGAGGDNVLVLRRDDAVALFRLSPAEYAFLAALGTGATLAAAWGEAASHQPGFDGVGCLQRHVTRRTVVGWRRLHDGDTRAGTDRT